MDDPGAYTHQRAARAARAAVGFAAGQPSWVVRVVAVAAVLLVFTILLALLVLALPIVAIGLVVFWGYARIRVLLGIGRRAHDNAGRKNVRVIRREP